MDCIFCKIVNKEIPADIVYENDDYIAFNDIYPKADTHILIIPKKHIESFHTTSEKEDKKIIKWLYDVAWEIVENKWLNWCKLLMNSWKENWQEVFHVHLHLMSY